MIRSFPRWEWCSRGPWMGRNGRNGYKKHEENANSDKKQQSKTESETRTRRTRTITRNEDWLLHIKNKNNSKNRNRTWVKITFIRQNKNKNNTSRTRTKHEQEHKITFSTSSAMKHSSCPVLPDFVHPTPYISAKKEGMSSASSPELITCRILNRTKDIPPKWH